MVKISIIMPVYNGEKFLKHTIQTILDQSLKEFELILIDDGSKDQSGDICDEFAKTDERIKVIHQENRGICGARNTGLKAAEGDYIAFADQDDDCLPGWLEENYRVAQKYNADLVKFGRIAETVDDNGKILKRDVRNLEIEFFDKAKLRENFFILRDKEVFSPVWDGLFKKSLIDKWGIRFCEKFKQGEEDTAFCLQFLPHVEKFCTNSGVYFKHYERYSTSTSSKFSIEALKKHIICSEIEVQSIKDLNLDPSCVEAILSNVHHHLLGQLLQLYHPKCDWPYRKKLNYIKHLHQFPQFQLGLTQEKLNKMSKKDKKKTFLSLLFEKHAEAVLLIVVYFYKKHLDRKFISQINQKN